MKLEIDLKKENIKTIELDSYEYLTIKKKTIYILKYIWYYKYI